MAKSRNRIHVIDVTNRDGVQTSRLGLAKLEKTMINLYLNDMGVFQSEFGFPVTPHETNYLNANLELAEMGRIKMRLSGWIRAIEKDVKDTFRLTPKIKYLNLSISTSRQMIEGKFRGKMVWKDVIDNMTSATKLSLELGAKEVGVNAEDSSRTEIDRLIEFAEAAKQAGAVRLRYCDTLGYDDPFSIYDRIKRLAEEVKMPIELHCHNDLGMAVATTVAGAKAAIDGGVDAYVNTTINGLGERAGNADLVSVILAIRKASGFEGKYHFAEKIDLTQSWKICRYASISMRVPIPINQPAIGDNAFAHESGIHADGALKDHRNYELYDHHEVGRGHIEQVETGRLITTGEYSGIKGFKNVAGKFELKFKDDEHAKKILELVRYANVHTQKPVTEDEMRFISKYPEQAKKIMTVMPPGTDPVIQYRP
ncbi:MAG: homocitrate synthase [Candidatus Altiarchaeota archaeon]